MMPALKVLASVDKAGNCTFSVNGKSIDNEKAASLQDGMLTYEPYAPDLGQVLTVRSPPFNLQIVAVKQFTDDVSGYNRGHFELHAQLVSKAHTRYSGVLGETLHKVFDAQADLDESRFEVPSLSYAALSAPLATRRLLQFDSFEGQLPAAASFGA